MLQLSSLIPHHESIKNIIFDFGGVICDLDIEKTVRKFRDFGEPKPERILPEKKQSGQFEQLVNAYEVSLISSQGFRNSIREYYRDEPSDNSVDEAWNACLVGIPGQRIELLKTIRNKYRIFLLSNSNEIHFDHYIRFLEEQGYPSFDALFEKAWFSFRIGLRKPDPEIFRFVLHDKSLDPSLTLFIDDSEINVQGALLAGMKGYHLKPGEDISALFS